MSHASGITVQQHTWKHYGKYKITCDKNGDGTAYLWAAMTNSTSLTADDLDGAKELEEEEEEDEDDQDDELLDELDTVIVSAGKTVDQIKAHARLREEEGRSTRPTCATRTAPSRPRNMSTSWGAAARRAVENKPRCQFGLKRSEFSSPVSTSRYTSRCFLWAICFGLAGPSVLADAWTQKFNDLLVTMQNGTILIASPFPPLPSITVLSKT